MGAFSRDGTPVKPREPNAFAIYVKEHMADLKRSLPTASHKELMVELGRRFKAAKESKAAAKPATDAGTTVGTFDGICEEIDQMEGRELDLTLDALTLGD